eukprot:gene15972-4832_t
MWRGIIALLCVLSAAKAWYIPGVSPQSYVANQEVYIKVNSLTSTANIVPYPFYSMKTCQPPREVRKAEAKQENLGEILWGDQIEPSLY